MLHHLPSQILWLLQISFFFYSYFKYLRLRNLTYNFYRHLRVVYSDTIHTNGYQNWTNHILSSYFSSKIAIYVCFIAHDIYLYKFKSDSFVVYNWKSVNCTNTHQAIFLTFPHWLESKYIMGHYTKIFYMQYRFISHYQCNDDFLISRELMYFRFLEFMPISFQLVFPFISYYTICTIAKCFESRFVSSIWSF